LKVRESAISIYPSSVSQPCLFRRVSLRHETLAHACCGRRIRVITKTTRAVTTIEGPEGVSNVADEYRPPTTEATPTMVAATAILSGLVEKRLTVAAGTTSNATISKTPTILIATAITAATRKPKIKCVRSGRNPATAARSTFTVAASNGRQSHHNTPRATAPPAHTTIRSNLETPRMSPNSRP